MNYYEVNLLNIVFKKVMKINLTINQNRLVTLLKIKE